MVRRFFLLLLIVGLVGCQQTREPIVLDEVASAARGGDSAARAQLVNMLGEERQATNDRVYALILELDETMVPELLPAVAAPDRIRREYVIAALGNFKAVAAIPAISGVLADTSLGRRYIAAWALGEIGTQKTIKPLLGALEDQQDEVRKYATRSLIKLGPLVVQPLVDFLGKNKEPRAHAAAIRALGDIADPSALVALLAHLEGPNRVEVITALGKLKDVRSLDALLGVLDDPDWRVRMKAAMALGAIGGEAQAAQLEPLLEDEVNVVREWAARSLETMTGKRYTYRNEAGEYVKPYNIYH